MHSTPLKLLISLIGFALLCFGYRGLTTGVVSIKGIFRITKEEKPTPYWVNVILCFVVGIAGIIFGLVSA